MKKVLLYLIFLICFSNYIYPQDDYNVKANTQIEKKEEYSIEQKFIMKYLPDSLVNRLLNSNRVGRLGNSGSSISLDYIDTIRHLILNKRLYINTKRWIKETGHEPESLDDYIDGKKYIPVTITKIGLGYKYDNPIKVVFRTANNNEYYLLLSFSLEKNYCLDDEKFITAFLLNNPKLKYPKISNEIWDLICSEHVRVGMTKNQCKLSWGEPESINKTSGSWGVHEQWVYSSSSYLYFENGILSSIQN